MKVILQSSLMYEIIDKDQLCIFNTVANKWHNIGMRQTTVDLQTPSEKKLLILWVFRTLNGQESSIF